MQNGPMQIAQELAPVSSTHYAEFDMEATTSSQDLSTINYQSQRGGNGGFG
jgi:hypothetical protein